MTHHGGGVPPGWYDDATGSGAQRWWDGQRWTDHRRAPQPPAHHPGGAPVPGAVYPQPVWSGYHATPPARRRRSRALWMTPLLVFVVLLVVYAFFYTASRGGHNDWYQKGYDEGMKTPVLSSDSGRLAAAVCSGAVVTKATERVSSSHKDDVEQGCHDAIQDRLNKMNSGSP